jgi:hypothetical protein
VALTGITVAAAAPDEASSGGTFTVIGLTDRQEVVAFAADDPGRGALIGGVSGLEGDRRIVAVDCRITDSELYGLGDRGGVYRISLDDAVATKVSQLSVDLDGQHFDIDFNPVANRLRIISDSGQNLRHNLDDATGTPAVGTTAVDSPLSVASVAGTAAGVTGAAYYNNDADPATATALFVIDTDTDQVAIQSPAGLLAATGDLGVDALGDAGLEIHYDESGGDTDGIGYAALDVDGTRELYRVDLLTGRADLVGGFPAAHQVSDLAAGFRRDELDGITLGEPYY